MFEKFIEELTQKAIADGADVDSIVNTYQNRYQLGIEAGMSEEEIVSRFGNVEDIVKTKQNKQTNQLKLFRIITPFGGDVTFKTSSDNAINIDMEERALDLYNTYISEEKLIIEPLKKESKLFRRADTDITISFPETTTFKEVDIKAINCDVDSKDFGFVCENFILNTTSGDCDFVYIKADETEISTVNGDITIDNLFVNSCEINTVSGDIKTKRGAINDLDVSTVNGDISINGKVEKINSSSISGDITINNVYERLPLITWLRKVSETFDK